MCLGPSHSHLRGKEQRGEGEISRGGAGEGEKVAGREEGEIAQKEMIKIKKLHLLYIE
jgi:hypothetical protein